MANAAIAAAQAAINAHNDALRLKPGGGEDIDLWHLLRSLVEWADAHKVDLDAELSGAREDIREMEANNSAAEENPFHPESPEGRAWAEGHKYGE